MHAYLWLKTAHLVFVIAWMATVFYLPRILVNLAEAGDDLAVRARLVLMGRRLYRFGHHMFGVAFVLGLVLWLGYGLASKIAMAALVIYFPVASAFYDGLRRTDPGWLDLARTMSASLSAPSRTPCADAARAMASRRAGSLASGSTWPRSAPGVKSASSMSSPPPAATTGCALSLCSPLPMGRGT
mgnify:CR=1 FL=1